MGPALLSILMLAMHHPADVFINQINIAEYAISLLPNGSHIHIGIVANKYFDVFNESKEKYENQILQELQKFNYALYINASLVTLQYIHNFKVPPGLPHIGLILGSESRVIGDMTGIKWLKKKTYVVVDITSQSKGLADLATSPDHVFSPFAFDANRFSNLLNNDVQLLCDTDMYVPSPANGSCQPCMNACAAMLPLNCTTLDIQRQCKYYENKPMNPDISAETTTPRYPEPIYVHDNRRLSLTITIEITIVCIILAVSVSLVLLYAMRPKVVRKWFQNLRSLYFDWIASMFSPLPHKLFDDVSHVALFDDFSDDELAFA